MGQMKFAGAMAFWLAVGVSGAAAQERGSLRALGHALADVYEKVAPSVVVLEVSKAPEGAGGDAFGWEFLFRDQGRSRRLPTPESEGSGFIIREDGYILTNAHVIEGAAVEGGVVARRQDGSRLPLRIVGIDDKTDLAVLQADVQGLPAVEWGDSDKVRVGEFVAGIGAPFELDYTLTAGIISAKGRSNLTSTVYEDYLQTDAAINPGNSGGPLCDLDGRVIGVNTLINGLSRGLSFAIPSRLARAVSDELIEKGRVVRPWLGIRIETLSENAALQQMSGVERGVLVRTIEPEAPASRSALQPADVIVELDGEPVATARELQQAVLRKEVGQKVNLKVWRRGLRTGDFRTVELTTEELPSAPTVAAGRGLRPLRPPSAHTERGGEALAVLGLEVQDLGENVAGQLGVEAAGVIVTHVEGGSPAALAGLQRRDVITAVGETVVSDAGEFRQALEQADRDEGVLLLVERGGKKTYAVLKL
jgi:serine protease Do